MRNIHTIFCSGCTNLHPHQQCTGVPFSVHSCHGFLPWLLLLFVVQSISHVQLFATTWTTAPQVSLSFTISWSLLKLMLIVLVMLSNHLILFSFCLQSFPALGSFPMSRLFTWTLFRWPKYWSFSFSISPSDEYSGLVTFRIDWFDLRAVQGTLKNLLQHHSSRASILWQER